MRHLFLFAVVAMIVLMAVPSAARADSPVNSPQGHAASASWPMAGANPQRTSWTPEEITGTLSPIWYKKFEAYIPPRVQIIAENNTLYISTANGLYALDATSGAEKWVYPTQLPLGHSPTIANGVAYVGGLDHKLHAVNASNGQGLWTFEAGAGFETNPLVVGDKVLLGSRDGYFYAIYAEGSSRAGTLAWKFKTGGPILFSAAYDAGNVYFASNDSHAYALNANSGTQVWKSAKLPGAGFTSWWPVVYRGRVIFAGSNNYRTSVTPGGEQITYKELTEVYPNHINEPRGTFVGPTGTEPGDWAAGTTTIDTSKSSGTTVPITQYLEQKPYRRTVFVLNAASGTEISYDFDHDGKKEYAPFLWVGTHSGTRYPPIVGGDGVLYQSNNFKSDKYIAGGNIVGWKMDTPFISIPNNGWNAVDEPQAYSAGGNVIYWQRCCDRLAQAFDVVNLHTHWSYYTYDLDDKLPGYNSMYWNPDANPPRNEYTTPYAAFGGRNGVYGFHADTNPPIPYNGKVYLHRSNAVIAFDGLKATPTELPVAKIVTPPAANMTLKTTDALAAELEAEVQKIVDAGHLRPAYTSHGIFDFRARDVCGDDFTAYFHNSSETILTLTKVFPYLSPGLQSQVKTYLENELAQYPPYTYNHTGWAGASRELFDLPDDVQASLGKLGTQQENYTWKNKSGWGRNPYLFYALWKYADNFGNAQTLFNASKNRLETPPSDAKLLKRPFEHNAFIAGYQGYLGLEKLAGKPETASVRNTLNHLLSLRANNFSTDSAYNDAGAGNSEAYCRTLNVASNFMFLTPELADYLRANALGKVQSAVTEYERVAPFWFVTLSQTGFAENSVSPLYDSHSIFMAKALILQEPASKLKKYLDVPAFYRGDLYHLDKIMAVLERELGAPQATTFFAQASPALQMVDAGGAAQYTISLTPFGSFNAPVTLSLATQPSGLNASFNTNTITPPGNATLTLTDQLGSGTFQLQINANGGGVSHAIPISFSVIKEKVYLPLVLR